jgi:hypothetical protein
VVLFFLSIAGPISASAQEQSQGDTQQVIEKLVPLEPGKPIEETLQGNSPFSTNTHSYNNN